MQQQFRTYTSKKIDREYSTQEMQEVDYILSKGIRYNYVKRSEEGVRTYKFTKSKLLFQTLTEYYNAK
jgi:hypothetical protein